MSKNDITGDSLVNKPLSKQGEENWDRIFGKKDTIKLSQHEVNSIETIEALIEIHDNKRRSRIDTIGQNGNEGLHYEPDEGQLTEDQYAKIKEYEYELNPSTGDVEKRFKDGVSKPNGEQFDE